MQTDKKQINITGYVISSLCEGQSVTISNGDKVIFTSIVVAVHEKTKRKVIIETLNSIYTVESKEYDVCFYHSPTPKRKKWSFKIFTKLFSRI